MKNKSHRPAVAAEPSEDDVRDSACHRDEQGGRAPGQDLAPWFEATAFLSANAPRHRKGTHHQPPIHDAERAGLSLDS